MKRRSFLKAMSAGLAGLVGLGTEPGITNADRIVAGPVTKDLIEGELGEYAGVRFGRTGFRQGQGIFEASRADTQAVVGAMQDHQRAMNKRYTQALKDLAFYDGKQWTADQRKRMNSK